MKVFVFLVGAIIALNCVAAQQPLSDSKWVYFDALARTQLAVAEQYSKLIYSTSKAYGLASVSDPSDEVIAIFERSQTSAKDAFDYFENTMTEALEESLELGDSLGAENQLAIDRISREMNRDECLNLYSYICNYIKDENLHSEEHCIAAGVAYMNFMAMQLQNSMIATETRLTYLASHLSQTEYLVASHVYDMEKALESMKLFVAEMKTKAIQCLSNPFGEMAQYVDMTRASQPHCYNSNAQPWTPDYPKAAEASEIKNIL